MAETVTGKTFESVVLKSSVPVVVDFFATWCGPCRQMGPLFDQIAEELGTSCRMVKINIDDDRDLAIRYGVSSIPTFLFFKDGAVVSKETGFMSKDTLTEKVNALLK